MFIPQGYTEKQVLEIIDRIVNLLGAKFRFGYYDTDDIKQEGVIFGMEALERFDHSKGYTLDNFLYTHIRNRMISLKRDKYVRHESPCPTCPFYDPENLKSKNQCAAFQDKSECEKFNKYEKRLNKKKNIIDASDIDKHELPNGSIDILDGLEHKELLQIIDDKLPLNLRADYIRMLHKVDVPKNRKFKVREAVLAILEEMKYE